MIDPRAYQGELSALTAAGLWAFATILFGRLGKRLSPLALNISKGAIAIVCLLLTLLFRQQLFSPLPTPAVLLLLSSGAIGIGFGDTAYFASVNELGPRRALLMGTLAPPLSAVLALVFLQEHLSLLAWMGIFVTLIGVAWVVSERTIAGRIHHLLRGVGLGILAAAGQAIGAVLSRAALVNTVVDPIWSALLRLVAGFVVLMVILATKPNWGRGIGQLRTGRLLVGVTIAAFFGTYLAIWLQQTAFKFAETGIAQSLLATSPVFILPMAMASGDRLSLRAILGAVIALVGMYLLFLG